jgi:hypothetical protein
LPRRKKQQPGPRNYKQWSRYGSPILSAEDLQSRYSAYRKGLSSAIPADEASPYLRSAQLSKTKAVEMTQDFLSRLLQINPTDIQHIENSAQRPARSGDLLLPSAINIEVKARAINPSRYPLNHVSVAELEFDPLSNYGFYDLSRLLDIRTEDLSNATVREFSHNSNDSYPLGSPEFLKVLIRPIATAELVIYCNPKEGHIYLYKRTEILKAIAQAIRNSGFRRGQGGENPNRLSVLVPLPRWRFQLDKDGKWRYSGIVSTSKEAEKAALVHFLTANTSQTKLGSSDISTDPPPGKDY